MKSKEEKFTPGKWVIEKTQSKLETKVMCGKKRIAEAKHYNVGGKDWTKNDPTYLEGISNAILIATAPELLKACKNSLRDIKKINKFLKQQGMHEYSLMENELNEVINKAIN